jgi:hypothetical protein
MPHALSLVSFPSLPVPRLAAGVQQRVFVTTKEAQRYLASNMYRTFTFTKEIRQNDSLLFLSVLVTQVAHYRHAADATPHISPDAGHSQSSKRGFSGE